MKSIEILMLLSITKISAEKESAFSLSSDNAPMECSFDISYKYIRR